MAKKRIKNHPFKNRVNKKTESQVEKRNKTIMGVFITVIMVGSLLGIFVYQDDYQGQAIEYTNSQDVIYNFLPGESKYQLELDDNYLDFYFHPYDLVSLVNETEIIHSMYNLGGVVITFDPDDLNLVYIDLARFEAANQLLNANIMVMSAKTKNSTTYSVLPVLTCDNATSELPIIYFKGGNETKIIQEDNCLIMQGKQFDFLRYKDLMVYYGYYIMP